MSQERLRQLRELGFRPNQLAIWCNARWVEIISYPYFEDVVYHGKAVTEVHIKIRKEIGNPTTLDTAKIEDVETLDYLRGKLENAPQYLINFYIERFKQLAEEHRVSKHRLFGVPCGT